MPTFRHFTSYWKRWRLTTKTKQLSRNTFYFATALHLLKTCLFWWQKIMILQGHNQGFFVNDVNQVRAILTIISVITISSIWCSMTWQDAQLPHCAYANVAVDFSVLCLEFCDFINNKKYLVSTNHCMKNLLHKKWSFPFH